MGPQKNAPAMSVVKTVRKGSSIAEVVQSSLSLASHHFVCLLADGAQCENPAGLAYDTETESRLLYEGSQGDDLSEVAPVVVGPVKDGKALDRLISGLWGKHCAVFLTSGPPLDDLRRHFRRFLKVKTEDGRVLLFRFYDPRVLRVFLPTCTPEEIFEFFGPVDAFFLEGEEPKTMVIFRKTDSGLEKEEVRLSE
jgi:hypothetical protein